MRSESHDEEATEPAGLSQTPYVRWPDSGETEKQQPQWQLLPLVLALALGAHASTHALSAIQPALEAHGLSPGAYALLSFAPMTMQVLLPTAWGAAFARSARTTLALAPALLLGGQLLFAGLGLRSEHDVSSMLLVMVGYCTFCVARAGITVVQHAAMARCLPRGWLVGGFIGQIAIAHAVAALSALYVPQILDEKGLAGAQLSVVPPAAVGSLSGALLAFWLRGKDKPPPLPPFSPEDALARRASFVVVCSECGVLVNRDAPFATTCAACEKAAALHRIAILL